MPPFVLTILKVVFLALLYFFVYRAIRAVVVDLRGAQSWRAEPPRQRAAQSRPQRERRKEPRTVVVLAEQGNRLASVPLQGNLQVGRADACQIKLSDTYVSSFHARIFSRDGEWYVEDLGSTNGTYMNQRRVTSPVEVRAGDRIRVGRTTLEFRR
ncbi:MAG TPA: FHA domain-containing protein [Actinomycetota bacterium]|nr:FHA domain-containing protein [Actinomycetota bacterium]